MTRWCSSASICAATSIPTCSASRSSTAISAPRSWAARKMTVSPWRSPAGSTTATSPRFAVGLAGTPMSAAVLKRLWPSVLAPKVREWVVEHVVSGSVDRVDIAANAPLSALHPGWSADAGGCAVDRDGRLGRRAQAGRGPAGHSRRRPQCPRQRPQRQGDARQGRHRSVARPQARDARRACSKWRTSA